MKNVLVVIATLLFAISASAQVDNTHFDLSLSLGKGNQISKGQFNTAATKQFFDELYRQTTFDISVGYYFRPQNSLGLEIFLDMGVGSASMEGNTGQLLNGTLIQGALGIMLNYRWVIDRNVVIIGAGIADMAYMEGSSYADDTYELQAETIGIPLKFKYEYKLSKNLGLGISAAAFMGAADEVTETENGVSNTTTSENGESLGISRWSVTVGPRFYF